jgi:sigma-B regulation protein RsbU (phosphoserine phosphatase)
MVKLSLLQEVPLFSSLSPAGIEVLTELLQEKAYPTQTVLFEEGDHGDCFYVVETGEITIIKAMDTPQEHVLAVRGAGEFIGEMSLLSRAGVRTASARVEPGSRLLEMRRADFDVFLHRVPDIAYEMLAVLSDRLNEAHNASIRELTEKNLQLEEAYASLKAAQQQIIEKEILERELKQARQIQQSMLPARLPKVKGYDLGAGSQPAQMVGGDFYDLIPLGVDRLGVVIGDVSGKGVSAALFMAQTLSLLRAQARLHREPVRVLRSVNQDLLERNASGMFVTLLYGILHLPSRQFVYARAGHLPPLLWDREGSAVSVPLGDGQILGIISDIELQRMSLTLPPGGTLLLYTDGVTEARNAQGVFLDEAGLYAWVPPLLNQPAQSLCDALIHSVLDYQGSAKQDDDITLIVVKAISL